jgi:hypothetical protein
LGSEKQFKNKFSDYKNVSFEEWQEIIPRVQKRAREGKDSEVFISGRPLEPKRLKLGINRYSSKINARSSPTGEEFHFYSDKTSIPTNNEATIVEQSFQDRISIATPPSAPLSPPPINSEPAIDQEIEEILRSEMPFPTGRGPSPISASNPLQNATSPGFQHGILHPALSICLFGYL